MPLQLTAIVREVCVTNRYKTELRQYIQKKRKRIAMLESLCDYCDELEWKVQDLQNKLEIIYDARTEVSNDEESNDSSHMDK
jgi:hypothetical protein